MRLVHGDHCCSVCETTCDSATDLKRRVRALEYDVQRLALALIEERELRGWARGAIEEKFAENGA